MQEVVSSTPTQLEDYLREQIAGFSASGVAERSQYIAYSMLAQMHMQRTEYEIAIPLLEQALRCLDIGMMTPDHFPVLEPLKGCYLRMGNYEGAERVLLRMMGFIEGLGATSDPEYSILQSELADVRARAAASR